MQKFFSQLKSFLMFAFFPLTLYAGGVTLYEIGSAEVRLASAGWSARAMDPSTVFTNPAGMTRFSCPQFEMGAQAIYLHCDFERSQGTTVSGTDGHSNEWLPAGSFFYVHPVNENISWGLGSLGYFGSSLRFNNDWVGRHSLTFNFLEGFSLVPALAYKINECFSVGVGVNAMYSVYRQKSDISNVLDNLPEGRLRLRDQVWGVGAVVGILFEPSACTRFGIQYLSRVNLKFKSRPEFSDIGPILEGFLEQTGVLSSTVTIRANVPQSVIISAYHDFSEHWTFMADAGWQQWSRFALASIRLADPTSRTLTVVPKFKDTWHVAGGAEYRFNDAWTFSGGIAYDSSAVSNAHRPLNFPVGSQWRFGTGSRWYYSNNLFFDFCYEYMWSGNLPVDIRTNVGILSGEIKGKFKSLSTQFISAQFNWVF